MHIHMPSLYAKLLSGGCLHRIACSRHFLLLLLPPAEERALPLLLSYVNVVALQEDEAASSSKARQQQQQRPSPRILVAAHTNVAVDRVLLGLQEAGFTNMLRVGSLARIAKRLLGVSLHSAGKKRDGEGGVGQGQRVGGVCSPLSCPSLTPTTHKNPKHQTSPRPAKRGPTSADMIVTSIEC
jgi:hypothetical protein